MHTCAQKRRRYLLLIEPTTTGLIPLCHGTLDDPEISTSVSQRTQVMQVRALRWPGHQHARAVQTQQPREATRGTAIRPVDGYGNNRTGRSREKLTRGERPCSWQPREPQPWPTRRCRSVFNRTLMSGSLQVCTHSAAGRCTTGTAGAQAAACALPLLVWARCRMLAEAERAEGPLEFQLRHV